MFRCYRLTMLFFLCILGHQSQIKIKNNACGWQSMPNDIISPATRATPPDRRAIPDSEICCPRDGLGNRPVWTSPARHGLQVTFRSDIIFLPSFFHLRCWHTSHTTTAELVCRFNTRPGLEAHTAGRFYINPIPTSPTLVRFGQ